MFTQTAGLWSLSALPGQNFMPLQKEPLLLATTQKVVRPGDLIISCNGVTKIEEMAQA